MICAALVAAAGVIGVIGIVNPRRAVEARRCPGGQLVGAPQPAVDPLRYRRGRQSSTPYRRRRDGRSQIHGTIEELVAEEHELWQKESPASRPTTTGIDSGS